MKTSLVLAAFVASGVVFLPGVAPAQSPGEMFRDCDVCPEMVVVPSGSFTMGSPSHEEGRNKDEGPRRGVTIREPFAVGKYEVTFDEWDACVQGGGCIRKACKVCDRSKDVDVFIRCLESGGCSNASEDEGWGRGRRPVIKVSWRHAWSYALWLSRKTGKEYRLLSESEWEYAARADTTGRYHFGDRLTPHKANYGQLNGGTVPVGSYPANGFGLHDMHGNVWEWVEDCWHDDYAGAPSDGSAWVSGGNCDKRVLRGGSWYDGPRSLRSAVRGSYFAGGRDDVSGFRVARTLTP